MKLVIIGDGGHGKVIKDIAEAAGWSVSAILDDRYKEVTFERDVLKGPVSAAQYFIGKGNQLILGIGSNTVRKSIVNQLNLDDEHYATVIHPSAVISKQAEVRAGTVCMPHTVINQGSVVGQHVILNTGAVIEHDNRIEPFVHLSPKATTTGNVTIGTGTHIGASAVIIPGVIVGEWSTVGAGAVIIHNTGNYETVVGNPGRVVKTYTPIQLNG
ncbi:acetyltransferase [Jeotgalibacillus malaysiensis]|uniref:acetyltransferase n=1 Tax=Jeotgalibacillus malaysiensis TaxID=1508404 RepID=UPI00384E3E9C